MTGIDRPLFRRIAALALSAAFAAFGMVGAALAEEAPRVAEAPEIAAEAYAVGDVSGEASGGVFDAFVKAGDCNEGNVDVAASFGSAGFYEEEPSCGEVEGFAEASSEEGAPIESDLSGDIPGADDPVVDEDPAADNGLAIDGAETGADDAPAPSEDSSPQDVRGADEVGGDDAVDSPDDPAESEDAAPTESAVSMSPLLQIEQPNAASAHDATIDTLSDSATPLNVAPTGTWVTENSLTYYRLPDGTNQTGYRQIDGDWYYLDPAANGARATGMQELDANTGAGTVRCLFGDDGKQHFGEALVDGAWCYFDPDHMGAQSRSSFVSLIGVYLAQGPKTVYYGPDGRMIYGELNLNDDWYYLAPNTGARAEAEFVRLDGAHLANGPKTVYYRSDGTMAHGEVRVGDDWYFMDRSSGARVADQLVTLSDGSNAYQGKDGKRVFGEAQVQSSWYYFDPADDGRAVRSRFVDLTGSYLAHGAKTVYYDRFGRMVYGELGLNGNWYYLQPSSGALVKNGFVWLTGSYLNGGAKVVYYGEDGRMAHGDQTVEGKAFHFDPVTGATDSLQYWQWRLAQAPTNGLIPGTDARQSLVDAVNLSVNRFYEGGYAVGFVMMDLSTGKGMALNADSDFYAASTIKGPYVASLYRNTFGSSGAASPYYRNMLDAIADSSNGDYIYLRRQFGTAGFNAFLDRSGVDHAKSERAYPWYSPRDLGKLWLQMGEYFNAAPTGRECANLYTHSYNSSIYYELGGERLVQSKPGWYPTEYPYTSTNDAGIVYAPTGAYMVTVLSNAPVRLDLTRNLIRSLDSLHTGMF